MSREHTIDRLLLEVGSKVQLQRSDIESIESAIRRGEALAPTWIVDHAGLHRVAPQLYCGLSCVVQGDSQARAIEAIRDGLESKYGQFIHGGLTQLLLQEQTRLARCLAARGIDALFMKGCALETLSIYPQESPRVMKDIDILVPSWQVAWQIMRILLEWDYEVLNTIARRPSQANRSHLNGTLEAARHDGSTMIKISIVVAPFPITFSEDLHVDLWQGAMEVATRGVTFRIPSIEHTLLLLVAHGVQDAFVRLRDVNDCAMLLERAGKDLDWQLFAHELRQNGLATPFLRLLRWTDVVYPSWRKLVPDLSVFRPTWKQSVVIRAPSIHRHSVWRQTCHLLGLLVSRRASILHVARSLRTLFGFRIYSHHEKLASFMDKVANIGRQTAQWRSRAGFSYWIPLLLAPVDTRDENTIRLLKGNCRAMRGDDSVILLITTVGKLIAITPCGFFLPTNNAFYDEADKKNAMETARRLCELISREGGESNDVFVDM